MQKNLSRYPSIDKPQNQKMPFLSKHPIIPNINIYTAITALSTFYREKMAIDCLDLTVDYKRMKNDAITISRALKELGAKKGDIIAISMPNLYQAVATFLACNRIGAITTFLNPAMSYNEVIKYLNEYESPIYINYNFSDETNQMIEAQTQVKHIITLNPQKVNNLDLGCDYHTTSTKATIDFHSLESISKFQKSKIEGFHSAQEDALILYTSGTTGKPKSVVLTNRNVLASGIYLKNSSNMSKNNDERTLVCVPFAYPYGFATSVLMTLMSGKTAILAPNISGETINYYLQKNPNIIFGSPALLELIMRNIPREQDLSSVTTFISGGDFLTEKANKKGVEFFKEHHAQVEIGNGSGNAETVSCGTNPVGIKLKPATAGRILTGTDVIVLDSEDIEKLNMVPAENLKEKRYYEEGILCVSGQHVFKEYYGNIELTKRVKFQRNGKTYFITGTLGYIDEEGYFTITGRQSRFYIMSSLNKVYCDHVQNIIASFDCVRDCAVVKTPDEENLYVSTAFIVLDEKYEKMSKDLIADHILELCKLPIMTTENTTQLKQYEIPAYIEIVDSLPRKQGTEKIDYDSLEKIAISKLPTAKKITFSNIE